MAGAPVLPVAVIKIAGNQDKGDMLLDRQIDQVAKRRARRVAQELGWRVGISLNPAHWAVEVDVRGMQKAKFPHSLLQNPRLANASVASTSSGKFSRRALDALY